MALTAQRRRNIAKAAKEQAAALPEGPERDQAEKTARAVLTALNQAIEARLDILETDLIPLLTAYAPYRAGLVHSVNQKLMAQIREMIQNMMRGVQTFDNPAIRGAILEALADVLPACRDALTDVDQRDAQRQKRKLD